VIKLLKNKLEKYFSIIKINFSKVLVYKYSFLIEIISLLFQFTASTYIWKYILENSPQIKNYSISSLTNYLLFSTIIKSITQNTTSMDIEKDIRTGNIYNFLILPIDYIYLYLFRDIGLSLGRIFLNSWLIIIYGVVFFDINICFNILNYSLFFISIIFSIIIYSEISILIGLLSFWTISQNGLRYANSVISAFFSGSLIPLDFYPDILKNISLFLPYRSIIYLPISVLQTNTIYSNLFQLLIQFLWVSVLFFINNKLKIKAFNSLEIVGG